MLTHPCVQLSDMQHAGFAEWIKLTEDRKVIRGQEYLKIVRQRSIEGAEGQYVQTITLVTVHPQNP